MRDDGVITLDDSIEMNEWNNESKEMWVEMRLHPVNRKTHTRTHNLQLKLNNNKEYSKDKVNWRKLLLIIHSLFEYLNKKDTEGT